MPISMNIKKLSIDKLGKIGNKTMTFYVLKNPNKTTKID
jgi:hypothetical protein